MSTECFHCGLPNPKDDQFVCNLIGEERSFCCAGCLAIAETLIENGLTDFYRFRQNSGTKPEELVPQQLRELQALDAPDLLEELSTTNGDTRQIELGIDGITCAACGWLIEKTLSSDKNVHSISVNVTTSRATLAWNKNGKLSNLLTSLNKLGYHAYPFSEDAREKSFEQTNQTYIKRLLVAALGMMQVMTYALAIYIGEFSDITSRYQLFLNWISAIVATPVVFYSAKPFFTSALRNLKAKQLGMNLPVSLAILSAYFASIYSLFTDGNVYYFDSVVMFTFFLLIGRFLEHRARYHSVLKQQNFQRLVPLSVDCRLANGKIKQKNIKRIQSGDVLVIYSGETIPVDGTLLERTAEINQSVLTGEFLPVRKQIGDNLTSGSTNNSSTLVMKVTKDFKHSHISQLITLQQNAEQIKPDSTTLADRIAHWYVLTLLSIALAAGSSWYFIQPDQVFPVVLSILVVSCPCALSLATPAAIAAATAQLSDLGLMIRTKRALSHLANIDRIFFDKTGTLTNGEMQIVEAISVSGKAIEEYIAIAASIEARSNHPLAKAFKQKAIIEKLDIRDATEWQEILSEGISATIGDTHYFIGNLQLFKNLQIEIQTVEPTSQQTYLYLAEQESHVATFVLQDSLNPTANKATDELSKMGYQLNIMSGDCRSSVNGILTGSPIYKRYWSMSAADKLTVIANSQQNGKHCLMVGDGFNDVGALSAASAGITMGSGTKLSKTSSDAVLVSSDLSMLPKTLKIARKVNRIIKQNLTWAVIYNLTAIPFAIMGLIPAWLAALGMSFSSLVVVLNSLRLRS